MTEELEQFKRLINLTEFAAAKGYVLVPKESTYASVVMQHPTSGDKLVVRRDPDEHWVYFAVGDATDHGTVIDFLLHRGSPNLGSVRRELKPWLAADRPRLDPACFRADVEPLPSDQRAVFAAYEQAREAPDSAFLRARGLRQDTLQLPRFAGTWRIDPRGNVVFPHTDEQGLLTGYEVKNADFTAFSAGGEKTLWRSREFPGDTRLVLTESAIDALSYHQLRPDSRTRYVSTAGSLAKRQPSAVRTAIGALGAGTVILAFDNDETGERLADEVQELVALANFVRSAPKKLKGWNQVLRAQLGLVGP